MANKPGAPIELRDELLQLLYWLEGEGLEADATAARLARFLTYPEPQVQTAMAALARRGDVCHEQTTGRFRLTEAGRREAARRFAEEFAPLLGQGHGECNDPDCECHTDPAAAAECHAARQQTER